MPNNDIAFLFISSVFSYRQKIYLFVYMRGWTFNSWYFTSFLLCLNSMAKIPLFRVRILRVESLTRGCILTQIPPRGPKKRERGAGMPRTQNQENSEVSRKMLSQGNQRNVREKRERNKNVRENWGEVAMIFKGLLRSQAAKNIAEEIFGKSEKIVRKIGEISYMNYKLATFW